MKIFYYTSTGNSLAVAKKLVGDGELISIPQIDLNATSVYEDDVIGIIFPVYNFTVPKRVQDFLANIKFKADYMFAIGTYGNLSAGAMDAFGKMAKKAGHRFDYVNQIVMLDNAIDYFDVDEQKATLAEKNVDVSIDLIKKDISSRKKYQVAANFMAKMMTKMNGSRQQKLDGAMAQKYIVNESCVKCGVCEKICPAGNIKVTDKVTFGNSCEGCMGCLHLCPQNALHIENEKSSARWRNPEVALEEIIKANNRITEN